MNKVQVPLSGPDITQREIDLVLSVLRSPVLSMGPMVVRFEQAVAAYCGADYGIAVSSGTAGLHLTMVAAGIKPGDEVITSPFSFVASANCILYEGGTPVFVDIDPQSLNLDPALVECAITPHTRAILPVHVFGQPADVAPILDIARRYQLIVVEDACEAIGAEYRGQQVGTFGQAAVFAFYPNKQITTAEGGMIVTHDAAWAGLFRSLRNQGRDDNGTWLHHVRLGYNYRLDELSAALGVAQMERIDELIARRAQVAAWYNTRLADVPGVRIPAIVPDTTRASWFVYVVRLAPELERDQVMELLDRFGVPSRPYFVPIHLQPLFRERFGYRPGDFPITEAVARSTLALPFFSLMGEDQVEYVCHTLKEAIRQIT
jgi:perosamine synthetase